MRILSLVLLAAFLCCTAVHAQSQDDASCTLEWDEDTEGELRIRGTDSQSELFLNYVTSYWPQQWQELKVVDEADFPGWFHAYTGAVVPNHHLDDTDEPDWGIVVKIAGTPKPVAHPMHPSGSFYFAELPGGAAALCRIYPGEFQVGAIEARFEGATIPLEKITVAQAVDFQLAGDTQKQDRSIWTEDELQCWHDLLEYDAAGEEKD